MAVLFSDEQSNAFPAGVQVILYPANAPQTPQYVVGTDWTQAGGLCPYLVVNGGSEYVAVFVGRQGPTVQQTFTGGSGITTDVTVAPYRSPSLTETNYAYLQTQTLYPQGEGWWGDEGRAPGGVAWAIAFAFGAIFSTLDTAAQNRLQAARVQSSSGSFVDSWVYDFLGQWLPRYTGESDSSFRARAYAALSAPKTTLQSIQNIVMAYFAAIAASQTGLMGFNAPIGAFDSIQGVYDFLAAGGASLPQILVWDRQSRPDLANEFGINPDNDDGSFVIQLGYAVANEQAWYLDYECLDYNSYLLEIDQFVETPPDPRLGALVNFVKAAGSKPIYLTTSITP